MEEKKLKPVFKYQTDNVTFKLTTKSREIINKYFKGRGTIPVIIEEALLLAQQNRRKFRDSLHQRKLIEKKNKEKNKL